MIYVKQISGTHFPSFKGRLAVNGTFGSQPLYQRGMSQKWVWFDVVSGGYVISKVAGTRGDYAFDQDVPSTNPDGAYHATGAHCEGAPVIGPITTPGEHGLIALWPFSIASIPTGWVLCDGTHGTPDLRGLWIVGAGGAYAPGDSVGALNHTHAATQAAHSHAATQLNHNHITTVSGGMALQAGNKIANVIPNGVFSDIGIGSMGGVTDSKAPVITVPNATPAITVPSANNAPLSKAYCWIMHL
jgi:hypothetical protein